MREILFRGKTACGAWVQGDLIHRKIWSSKFEVIRVDDSGFDNYTEYEIATDTIGQFTGLTDKNGKKIFEGDMLNPFDDEFDKMVVEFNHGGFLLCIYGERGYMGEGGWCEEGNYGVIECEPLSSYGDDIEIIGNIHDRPDLMEGAADGK